jgi:cytochrome c-type biogenesis protein
VLEAPNIALAFAAGFVSFVSPCCLPLVPGYLATVSGVDARVVGRGVDPRVLGRSVGS